MDEDGIDVLGDLSLESLLANGDSMSYIFDSINCGGGGSGEWFMNHAGGSQWYHGDTVSCESQHHSVSWTDKEKYLLEKGFELFGHSWSRLSQYIGSKSAHQVRAYVKKRSGGVTSPMAIVKGQVMTTCEDGLLERTTTGEGIIEFEEIIDDIEIPASMEEVITVVSTAQPTVRSAAEDWKRGPAKSAGSDLHPPTKKRRNNVSTVKLVNRNRGKLKEKKFNVIKEKPEGTVMSSQLNTAVLATCDAEEIVKIKYEDPSEDSEVDIEDHEEDEQSHPGSTTVAEEAPPPEMAVVDRPGWRGGTSRYSAVNQKRLEAVHALPPPTRETTVDDPSLVTDQEVRLHPEFFPDSDDDGRLRSRYIKIRNHIVERWKETRPNYLTKTCARNALKNCGDVNLIGRVHAYLEQIGAINFGCKQCHYNTWTAEQTSVEEVPMLDTFEVDKEAAVTGSTAGVHPPIRPMRETRIRKKRVWSPEPPSSDGGDGGGGLTMAHDATGAVTVTVVSAEPTPTLPASRRHHRKDAVNLITCRTFTTQFPAHYRVVVNLHCLLLGELHSQSSPGGGEVIGLLGGRYDPEDRVLNVTVLAPCRAVTSTNVHCDMCPVSQCEVGERLMSSGVSVVGWYHSHPTWEEHPSLQDVATQSTLQNYFKNSSSIYSPPFTALIFSPQHSAINFFTLEVIDGCQTPFSLDWSVVTPPDGLDPDALIDDLRDILAMPHPDATICTDHGLPESTVRRCIRNMRRYFDICLHRTEEDEELFEEVVRRIRHAFNALVD